MKSPKAIGLVKDLLKYIDVVVENFRGGVMERWGLGYDDLKKTNPGIVVCSASGFGRTGPMKDEPAYAPVIDGLSGYAHVNGYPDGEPAEAGAGGFADTIAAFHGAYAILAALYHRAKPVRVNSWTSQCLRQRWPSPRKQCLNTPSMDG